MHPKIKEFYDSLPNSYHWNMNWGQIIFKKKVFDFALQDQPNVSRDKIHKVYVDVSFIPIKYKKSNT